MIRALIWCAVSSQAQTEPDKISLPQQEADARSLAEGNGWEIVDTLIVPGHSRRYVDFHRLASDAAKQGVDAFHCLQRHWEAQDFDVLVVRDGDRFARTQALHAYVVERTINIKARIYSLQDGWIDDTNYRMFIAMSGYKAAGDIDRLVKARDRAMTARAKRGLPVSSRVSMCHNLVRDPDSGKAIVLEVNEDRRQLWDDLAELILEGIGWYHIENELYDRYGHVNDKGKKFYSGFMYRLVMRPLFWGHMARNHANAASKNGHKTGYWVYDENEPMPKGATIFRNTHDAVYTGEQAELVKAELRRRSQSVRGRTSSKKTQRFSGLGVCAECGSFWNAQVNGNYRGVRCPAVYSSRTFMPDCNNRGICNEKKIVALLSDYLHEMLKTRSTDVFKQPNTGEASVKARLKDLEREMTALEEQARTLIRKQASAGDAIRSLYDEELAEISNRLENMEVTRSRLEDKAKEAEKTLPIETATLDELAAMSIEAFWKQESRYINQVLHRLMGKKRLLLLDGEIIGVAEVDRPQRNHT